ncbi:MAG: ABC transporter permease [Opitutales bacterium]
MSSPAQKEATAPSDPSLEVGTSLWQEALRRLRQNRAAVVSFWILVGIVAFCLIAPVLSPYDTVEAAGGIAEGPSWSNWFGTDDQERDLLTRVAVGGRISLAVGLVATLVALFIGVTYGALAGYLGGATSSVMMRIVDVLYALPFTILVILLMTMFERNFLLLFAAIGAVEWLTMARIVYGQVRSLKQQEFVEAAVALGLPLHLIVWRHLLPNVLGVVVVYATLTVPAVMLLESFLSFLGLGVPPPMPSWGDLIKNGAENMTLYPHLLVIPALFFSVTLFCLNFLGDGLRDALDPKAGRD